MDHQQKYGRVTGHADCPMKILRNRSGMTLLEMMFAVLLTSMIFAALWGVTIFMERLRAQDEIRMGITNEVRQTMERMQWGFKPQDDPNAQRDGIREAASFVVQDNGARLSFTGSDGTTRQIRLNGTVIEYTEPGLAQGWETLYAPDPGDDAVTTLTFSNSNNAADVVVIELVIGKRVRERWFYASLQSKVLARN